MRAFIPILIVFVTSVVPAQPPTKQEEDPAVALAKKIAEEVARFRELSWKREVDIASYDLKQLKAFVMKALDEEMPDALADKSTRAFRMLGLIPEDYDVKRGLKELLVEQIGGFYDPDAKQLRVIDRSNVEDDAVTKMVERMGLSAKDMDRTVMAHELVHALQDQHFDLARLPLDLTNDDDLVVGMASLVEGDATLSMMGMMMPGANADRIFARAKQLALTVKLMGGMSGLAPGDMKAFKEAPEVLKQRLMFPYLGGLLFCLDAGQDGKGFKGIDAAFSAPPLSTEHVLHPEKRLGAEPDWPQVLAVPFPPNGPQPIYDNTLGELFTTVLLQSAMKKREAKKAAAGWDGDRYLLFAGEGAKDTLVWVSTWDTAEDAKEFLAAVKVWSGKQGEREAGLMFRKGVDVLVGLGPDLEKVAGDPESLLSRMKRTERRALPERGRK